MVEIAACRLAAFHENFMRTLCDLFVGGCVIWGCHFFSHGWYFFRLKLVTVILAFGLFPFVFIAFFKLDSMPFEDLMDAINLG